jgi:hypothetical protein
MNGQDRQPAAESRDHKRAAGLEGLQCQRQNAPVLKELQDEGRTSRQGSRVLNDKGGKQLVHEINPWR